MSYAFRRAAEITLMNGYKYFQVVNEKNRSEVLCHDEQVIDSREPGVVRFSDESQSALRPAFTVKVKCYNHKPRDVEVVDAEYYLAENSV